MLEIQVLAWNRDKNVMGLNQLRRFQTPYDNWISNDNTDINVNKQCYYFFL
jgi:hypothetical protein